MSINYSRKLTGKSRTKDANEQLGFVLAFVAGATNAGGFLAVEQFTSHMTGVVSSIAGEVAVGDYELVLTGIASVFSFLMGAAFSVFMVIYSRSRNMHSEYAFPLCVEAGLLMCLGLSGATIADDSDGVFASLTVMSLCFIMGLQNAVITKLSNAEIRTTHLTGILTDMGIELGKLFYWNRSYQTEFAVDKVNKHRLKVLSSLLFFFAVGCFAGAFGFDYLGYVAAVPLALVLMTLTIAPIADDVVEFMHNRKNRRPL